MRELLLSDDGATLADVYPFGGEVLMGSMRWEKENAMRAAQEGADATAKLRRISIEAAETELAAKMKGLQAEMLAKQMEMALLDRSDKMSEEAVSRNRQRIQDLRNPDAALLSSV